MSVPLEKRVVIATEYNLKNKQCPVYQIVFNSTSIEQLTQQFLGDTIDRPSHNILENGYFVVENDFYDGICLNKENNQLYLDDYSLIMKKFCIFDSNLNGNHDWNKLVDTESRLVFSPFLIDSMDCDATNKKSYFTSTDYNFDKNYNRMNINLNLNVLNNNFSIGNYVNHPFNSGNLIITIILFSLTCCLFCTCMACFYCYCKRQRGIGMRRINTHESKGNKSVDHILGPRIGKKIKFIFFVHCG